LKKLKIRIDNHMTLRERIVETIRNAIVNGQLAPGAGSRNRNWPKSSGSAGRRSGRRSVSWSRRVSSPWCRARGHRRLPVAADIADFYDLKMVLEGYAARCAVTTSRNRT